MALGVEPDSNGNQYQEYFLRDKEGRYVGMTNLPHLCASTCCSPKGLYKGSLMWNTGVKCSYGQSPCPLLCAGSRVAGGKITVSGIANSLNYYGHTDVCFVDTTKCAVGTPVPWHYTATQCTPFVAKDFRRITQLTATPGRQH